MADAERAVQNIDFDKPQVRLLGELNQAAAAAFLDALGAAPDNNSPIIIEVTTPGGEAELGRRLALEVERMRKSGRRLLFVGKTQCYSAGITLMSAFPVRDRFLTRDCRLLIHSRQLEKKVELAGPLRESLPFIEAVAAEIRVGIQLEDEGFAQLIAGSDVTMEEIRSKAPGNWYLGAEEALQRRLVGELI